MHIVTPPNVGKSTECMALTVLALAATADVAAPWTEPVAHTIDLKLPNHSHNVDAIREERLRRKAENFKKRNKQ